MAKKTSGRDAGLAALREALKTGPVGSLYLFHGEERYLLEHYLGALRERILTPGTEEFNHKRISGKKLDLAALSEAVDALPVFAERTLIEIRDADIFKAPEDQKDELIRLLADLPDYVCVVFVYDDAPFKPDARVKQNAALKKLFTVVDFQPQGQGELGRWIAKHFMARGKKIDAATAEYLAFITGGLMSSLLTEIEKVAAFETGERITRAAIDAVCTPVLDAAVYRMTDALLGRKTDTAARVLYELLSMQESPHKILYSISAKMRQLLVAKLCVEDGQDAATLKEICGISHDFQARSLFTAARGVSLAYCREAVGQCCAAALRLNSSAASEGGAILTELLIKLTV